MNLVILPLLVPLLTAVALLFWGRPSVGRRTLAAVSALAQLGIAVWLGVRTYQEGPCVLPLGHWAAPYGIMLVADLLSAVMVTLSAFTAWMAVLYGFAELSPCQGHTRYKLRGLTQKLSPVRSVGRGLAVHEAHPDLGRARCQSGQLGPVRHAGRVPSPTPPVGPRASRAAS